MLESEAYKTYHAYATGDKIPKLKYVKNKVDSESSPKKKSTQASNGNRIKTSTKVAKPIKKKQPTTMSKEKGLNVLYEVALSEVEQIKLATKRSLIQTHNSHASGDKDDDDEVHMSEDDDNQNDDDADNEDDNNQNNDDADNEDDDDQNDDNADNKGDDDQDDDNEQTESDNDDDDLEEELDEEQTNEEEEANKLYMDVNINLEGRDTEMTDAPHTNIQNTQVTEDTHVIITAATPEGQQLSSSVSSGFISNMLIPNPDTDRLRDEAQAENVDFINTLNENMRKIIKKQVKEQVKEQFSKILPKIKKFVNDQLEAEVLTRSSNQAKTSHVVAANLSELEPKKILIDKMENNKSINRRRDDEDEDEEPSAGSNRGSAQAGEPIHANKDLEEPAHQEFDTGFTEDQPVDVTTQHPDWFQKPTKPPTPDRDWNKTFPTKHGLVQPWISTLAQNEDPRESFNELMDTPLDFSTFVMNQLKVDTLTPELLVGLTYELMKGHQYPHDLRKTLPLIPNSRGRRVIPFDHFVNNDLAYLSGGISSRTYATSVTKTKAVDYGHIKWIEDFIPNSMWSQVSSVYDKHALWGISHWGRKRQQFYGFAVNRESSRDVYSKHRILAFTKLKIVEWHNYKHLEWITVRRNDDKLYTFKEGDYNRLRLQDIEDMLLLLVQGKLTNLNVKERLALGISLRMFTRSVVLRRHVEDLQLGIQIPDKSRKGLGFVSYNAVPPPPTGLFSPLNLDLSNSGLDEFQQPEFKGYGPKTSKNVSENTSNEVRESSDALMVKKLVLDDKLKKKIVFPTVAKIEFVRPKQQEKPVRKLVKYVEMYRERVESRNNYTRVNYNYSAKKAHPSAYRNMAPRAVSMKTGLRSLNTTEGLKTAA
ncbi:hypothetical protein Tco_0817227 [Tanacetum coccineum]